MMDIDFTVATNEEVGLAHIEVIIDDAVLVVGDGSSKRHPSDLPDMDHGRNIALGRALVDAGNRLLATSRVAVIPPVSMQPTDEERPLVEQLYIELFAQGEKLVRLRNKVKKLKRQKGAMGAALQAAAPESKLRSTISML